MIDVRLRMCALSTIACKIPICKFFAIRKNRQEGMLPIYIIFRSLARFAACVLFSACNLLKIFDTWFFTVPSASTNLSAISRLLAPAEQFEHFNLACAEFLID